MLYSWGRGEDGQCGNGDTVDQDLPTVVEALKHKTVVGVACGSGHTCVLTDDGDVFSWGRGDDGRLGHSDCTWKYVPRRVRALSGKQVKAITCGSYHTAAVTEEGVLYTWGGGMYGKLGHGNELGHPSPCRVEALMNHKVDQVACGSRHTAALLVTGEVYVWGDRENGVCGVGETEGHQFLPRVIDALKGRVIKQVAACGFHTGAITETGELYTWGEGKFGRLGHGTERNQNVPRLVEALIGRKVKLIACGGFHSACVTDKHEVLTFGGGEHGQLGHGDKTNRTSPVVVEALLGQQCVQVTCGWSHSVALTQDGKVFSWGNGDHGKLGHGDSAKQCTPKLVEPLSPLTVTRVASYNEHTVAVCDRPEEDEHAVMLSASFLRDLRGLVNSPDFSDVTLVVEGRKIHAHKAILAQRCEHFRAMFRSGMLESKASEVVIPLPTQYSTFLSLLEFLYTDSAPRDLAPDSAIDLYMASDLYGIERLKGLCEESVVKGLRVDNAAGLLQAADDQHAVRMKELCTSYIVEHFDAVTKTEAFARLSREAILDLLRARF